MTSIYKKKEKKLRRGTLWARIAKNVKKPPLTVNVINFEFFGFSVSTWVLGVPMVPPKSNNTW